MAQDFDFYHKREGCRNLVLFVHGFTGDSKNTWTNANGTAFPELLLADETISDNFDVASYNYFTELLNLFADTKEKARRIRDLIRRRTHKKERNLDIDELSKNLSSHLRFSLEQYDNIYVIAHSMGGLITKSLIKNDLNLNSHTKVKLFISLAVPHQGASSAVLGSIISSNLQISNLNPVEQFITELNQSWVYLDSKPTTKYFYGGYDNIVTKYSAVAIDKIEKDIVSVAEDHTTICKPENNQAIVYLSVLQFIKEQFKNEELSDIGFQKLNDSDGSDLDNELFVLKLIVANIEEDTQDNAKELYYNAEFVRKLFNSRHDKEKLERLFVNIRQLYKDSYDKYLADNSVNSGILLSEVHTKITEQDSLLLKSLIPSLQNFHKKGMLHQMANDSTYDIWWCKDKSIDKVK
ncbi:ABC-three component system protein [Vibrio jasicida]|uniref:ABC-three component system protein n=1 Tax=Vibrio jasicida TaxID=766224 RepID=UPI0016408B80|nr:ABC-three component system protein [Vibrio jasicida]